MSLRNKQKVYAVILAGGVGARFGQGLPKQLASIRGRSVIEYSLAEFDAIDRIDEIIVVSHPDISSTVSNIIDSGEYRKPIRLIGSGASRTESSRNAVRLIGDDDLILVHDAVRPFFTMNLVMRCLSALEKHAAVYPVVPAVSTIVQSSDGEFVAEVPWRTEMKIGQTPQGFRGWVIRAAHRMALADPLAAQVTNDCGLVKRYKLAPILLVEGERHNVKITYPEDLKLAETYLEIKEESARSLASASNRIG